MLIPNRRILTPIVKPLAWGGLLYYILWTLFEDDEEDDRSSGSRLGNGGSLIKKVTEEEDAEDEDEDEDDVEDEDEDEDDTIFIPLGFAYQLPKTFYKGSDLEWQSFMELSRDKKRCLALRSTYRQRVKLISLANSLLDELTGMVGRYVGALPQIESVLGKDNIPKRYWLDIDFPEGPPPEYERKGFELPLCTLSRSS